MSLPVLGQLAWLRCRRCGNAVRVGRERAIRPGGPMGWRLRARYWFHDHFVSRWRPVDGHRCPGLPRGPITMIEGLEIEPREGLS